VTEEGAPAPWKPINLKENVLIKQTILWLCRDPHSTPFCAPVSKLDGETPRQIRAWSLICNEKPTVLFEKNCHGTEKSEAIA
jgi:hypothetical protein